jgi:hypothetical protein
MPEAYKRLAAQTVGVTKVTVYTVPAATSTIVKSMKVVGLLNTSQTITIWHYANVGAVEMRILYVMPIDALGQAEWDGTICLATADTISVQANIAAAFEFSMYGIEVT